MSAVVTSSPPAIDPRRYHDSVEAVSSIAARDPVCLYLETTNRCNLLCTTCPRTYADLEPEADLSWELFTRIVDQVPNIARVVLHGVGEPMLVKELPRMVRYLKAARRLCAVQHQWHGADPEEGPRACGYWPR